MQGDGGMCVLAAEVEGEQDVFGSEKAAVARIEKMFIAESIVKVVD